MSDLLLVKSISILIIFGGSLLFGLLPAFRIFAAFPRFALSLILSYGGGILIATSLVHILPEAREGIKSAWPHSSFSAEMVLCMGIFIVYLVEEIAHFLVCHDLHSPIGHPGGDDGHNHGVHVHHDEPPNRCEEPAAVFLFAEEKTRSGEHGQGLNQNNQSGRCHGHGHSHGHGHGGSNNHVHELGGGEGGGHSHAHVLAEQTTKLFPSSTPTTKFINPAESKEDRKTVVARLRSLVGLIALSVHAGLEGLSVGLGQDQNDVLTLCFAVSAHKFVIAFCLGMEVRNASANMCSLAVSASRSSSFKFRYVLFFALMTPLGIAIGTGITELVQSPDGTSQNGLVGILQALASGTLLYVAFFEVILRERVRFSGKGLAQLALVILGWVTMVLVEVFIGHSHKESHDHDHSHDNEIMNTTTTTTVLPILASNLNDSSNLLI